MCWQKNSEKTFKGENSSLKRIGSLIYGLANSDKHLGSIVLKYWKTYLVFYILCYFCFVLSSDEQWLFFLISAFPVLTPDIQTTWGTNYSW